MPSLGRYFVIKSKLNGLALDINNEKMTPRNKVITYAYHGKDNQLWYKDPESDAIRSKCDDSFALDLSYDKELIIEKFNPNKATQAWDRSGDYLCLKGTNKVADISGANQKPGATILAYEKHGNINQKWIFEYQSRKYFQIMSRLNGKCLDICEGKLPPGAKVFMYTPHGRDNQLWYEDANGCIISKLNGLTFKFTHCGLETTPVTAEVGIIKRGNFLEPKNKNSIQCLDICEENRSNGAKVIMYNKHGGANQQWYYNYV